MTPGFVPPEVSDDPQARSDYGAVARLAETAVDVELVLHAAAVPVRGAIVAERRALELVAE